MARRRWSVDFAEWPPADQAAWRAATERRPLFQGRALAAGWAPATRVGVQQAYGQWLHFLARHGWLASGDAPCRQVTPERLAAYVSELQGRIAPMSTASQLRDLGEALRVMDTDGDRRLVVDAAAAVRESAYPSRDDAAKIVGASEFYAAALERMARYAPGLGVDVASTMAFEGGLMMALAICKPMRRKILVALEIGTSLIALEAGGFGLKLRKGKTPKAARADVELPAGLSPFIRDWCSTGRPFLLGGRQSGALWLGPDGSDLTTPAFYHRFCRVTREEFGVAINPHMVRKIAATGLAVSSPQDVEIIREVLDHESDEMRKRWYDRADGLAASFRYVRLLQARRELALRRTQRGSGTSSA